MSKWKNENKPYLAAYQRAYQRRNAMKSLQQKIVRLDEALAKIKQRPAAERRIEEQRLRALRTRAAAALEIIRTDHRMEGFRLRRSGRLL